MASPIRKKRFAASTQRLLVQTGVGVVIVVAVIGLAVSYLSKTGADSERLQQQAQQQQSVAMARHFADVMKAYKKQLSEISADPGLVELLQNAKPFALRQKEQNLAKLIPSALRVRLLRADNREVDNESHPPLTYASLDMLRRARTMTSAVNAEVHLFGHADEHIEVLQRINNTDQQLLGFVHLSLTLDPLKAAMEVLKVGAGYVELQQSVPKGQPIILVSKGNKNLVNAIAKPVKTHVATTNWNVLIWFADGDVPIVEDGSALGSGLDLQLVAMIVGIIVLLIIILLIKRRSSGGGSDTATYTGAIKNILDGEYPGVECLIPGMPAYGRPIEDTAIEPAGVGLQGEDITRISVPGDAGVEDDTQSPGIEVDDAFDISGGELPEDSFDISGASDVPTAESEAVTVEHQTDGEIPQSIFRAYDIRGVVDKTLTEDGVYKIGMAIGSEAEKRGQQGVVVARDGRNSGPTLLEALIRGLRDSGRDVIDIGMVPTPVLYFANHFLETGTGVMLTGSHNPPDYNGLKIVIDGETLSGETIQDLYRRIQENDFASGEGNLQHADIGADYIRRISEDIPVALGSSFKVVIDCGNGVAGNLAPQLIRSLGHDVVELFCEVDGNFPNHHPDPSQPENLQDLINKVAETGADLGFAFDGDGDRLGVVDAGGTIIWPDRQMMLFATDVLSRNPGADIIYDVKCSRHLKACIEQASGRALMWKTGHSLIKAKMKETGSPLAGEMSGHIFFKERWYGFDDGLYAAARLLEILTNESRLPAEVFAELPGGVATPELKMDVPEEEHVGFMEELLDKADFADAEISTIDGLRVDFADSWGLVRASNTTPCLVMRFEADDEAALGRVQDAFRELIQQVDPSKTLPF